jgi:hypothetical protein
MADGGLGDKQFLSRFREAEVTRCGIKNAQGIQRW